MSYALLSEVWPDMEINTSVPSKKKKKSKKNKENLSPLITEVSEMELNYYLIIIMIMPNRKIKRL